MPGWLWTALQDEHLGTSCLQVQLRPGDMSYAQFLSKAEGQTAVKPHVAEASDTCNILFSSGTTGNKLLPHFHNIPVAPSSNCLSCFPACVAVCARQQDITGTSGCTSRYTDTL